MREVSRHEKQSSTLNFAEAGRPGFPWRSSDEVEICLSLVAPNLLKTD
jgi:hypothetical protein